MRRIAILLVLLGGLAWAAAPPIEPGKGVGKVKLGRSLAEIEQALGKADQVSSSPNDPDSKFYTYKKFGVMVFVGSGGKVIGVTITSAQYRTPEGIGVGSTRGQVEQAYGRGLSRGEGNVNYAARGLAVSYQGGKVSHVYVFTPEESRPLLGDRLIVPGVRVGDLKVGAPAASVRQAWGAPTTVSPLSGVQGEVWHYEDQAVSLVIHGDKIHGVMVGTGDFITREGLKVGSSADEAVRIYGRDYEESGQHRWYKLKGIGFQLAGGRISEIRILPPAR
ncbi:MAG: hypothetical protein AB1758_13320 [Candidatus Eremiobacterota bacterium]